MFFRRYANFNKGIKMNTSGNFKVFSVSVLLVVGLAACDQPGPAETAGKKLDQAVDQVSNKIADTADIAANNLDAQKAKAGVSINDAEITARVKAAIFAEPGLKTLQISVDTINGKVTLSGSVDTPQNSETVSVLASAVSGVHEVENHLMIKPNN